MENGVKKAACHGLSVLISPFQSSIIPPFRRPMGWALQPCPEPCPEPKSKWISVLDKVLDKVCKTHAKIAGKCKMGVSEESKSQAQKSRKSSGFQELWDHSEIDLEWT